MGLTATASGGEDFPIVSTGLHVARLYSIVDLGLQEIEYKGQKKQKHKVLLTFELPKDLMEDGRPFSVSTQPTLSLHEKAMLRKLLDGWRGVPFTNEQLESFDISTLLDRPGMMNIVHNESDGKTYANIDSMAPPMDGVEIPPRINELVLLDLDNFSQDAFDRLPEWVQNKINRDIPAATGTDGPDW